MVSVRAICFDQMSPARALPRLRSYDFYIFATFETLFVLIVEKSMSTLGNVFKKIFKETEINLMVAMKGSHRAGNRSQRLY
jgi:hypothetical protein